jgi:threo-3-hydroxy-L-aspartate ammonia-lyase
MAVNPAVTFADIELAASRIAGIANVTPVVTSRSFDALAGCTTFFKCENFQRMGAFKFRGACNAIRALSDDARRRGVVAFSSGNHAQAIALAARIEGISATIVMPSNAPKVKIDATRGYGAAVVFYDPKTEKRDEVAARVQAETGAELIPPFDHPHVIAGQGTTAKELLEATGPLDFLFVCTGGAGLLSGCAVAARTLAPDIRVVGVEPALGDDVTRSFHTGERVVLPSTPATIADGARTEAPGILTLPLVQQHVYEMMTVDDEALVDMMLWIWQRMKLVIEPTGALAAAGVRSGQIEVRGARVGVILSGGNVDLAAMAPYFSRPPLAQST